MKKIILNLAALFVSAAAFALTVSAAVLPAPEVKATTASSTRINVSWNKIKDAEKYTLYISKFNEKQGCYSALKPAFTTDKSSYTVKNLQSAGKYKFAVVPLDVSDKGVVTQGKQSAAVTAATGGYYAKSYTAYEDEEFTNSAKYIYDSKGNKITVKTQANGSEVVRSTRTYDKNGNVLTEEGNFYANQSPADEDEYKDDGKLVYTYDEKGNRLTATHYNKYDGEEDYTATYTYDDDGNLLTEKTPRRDAEYTYDDSGNLLRKKLQITYAKKTSKSDTKYTYDKNGSLLTEKTGISNRVYTYGKSGNLLTDTCYNAYGYENRTEKHVYTYDKDGNLLSDTLTQDDESTGNKYKSQKVMTYDSKGNLLTSTETDAFNNTRIYVYKYDKDGNVLSEINDRILDTQGIHKEWQFKTVYTY